jgi:pimeloyl-ACP methyl ester carboxylesterase
VRFAERVVAVHRSLSAGGIGHGFGGAIALAYAVNEPRATVDIDINVAGDPADPRDVLEALPSGVAWSTTDVRVIKRDGQVRLWWDDTAVDLFFPQHELHGVVAGRYRLVPFADVTIPVLSPTDLVIFKSLFNRTKDWADIEAVLRAGTADVPEALRWIARIAGAESPSFRRLDALAEADLDVPDIGPDLWRSP